ncbi:DUF4292 domain-containing protein [Flavobacterium restrictum]|uniref:DUF4292 domain-containing protein n=1 Tax=Flavobacterium restrictum TaxID=2594428 RepID=A0A553E5V8_9FLAO|nr:DUF4292 domain-containing protein [Flavobacterium restrictum]TRX40436.1 DUF4292 domain-containing protein [Flavobacterium restrictum]
MKKGLSLILLVLLFSCKSKSVAVQEVQPVKRLNSEIIIEKHYNNKNDFSTLYIKSNARFANDKQTQNVTAEIKIEKDKQILVSIRFLGITMAKALITPTAVQYYEKINGSYFEGDFSSLSQWLGTDLDFAKIQNLLLGEAIDNLKNGKYADSLADQTYRLDDLSNGNTKKTFFLDAISYLVTKQQITQTAEDRMIQVAYSGVKTYKEAILPSNVIINTYQKKGKSEISLGYTTVTFNEELSFPYSVPNGYKKILIK